MADITRITLAAFSAVISLHLPKGTKVYAADVSVGLEGVRAVLADGSNATRRDYDTRLAQACILAAIRLLNESTSLRSAGGASAGREWVRSGKPHFTVINGQFDIACPGKSEPRSRWNSKRLTLSKSKAATEIDVYSVDIVKGEKGEIHFVPIG